MRKTIPPQSFSSRCLISSTILAGALVAVLAATPLLNAQAPAPKPEPVTTDKTVRTHKKSTVARAKTQPAAKPALEAAAPAPVTPPEPVRPAWPANDQPSAATVTWDSHGLRIEAANSSLRQILEDVSSATGTLIQGLGNDQRIYGTLGPGQAREVISQLLQGSGYNILMIGDQGQGTPRQILLTSRNATDSPSATNKTAAKKQEDDDDDADEPAQPVQPSPAPAQPNASDSSSRSPQQTGNQTRQGPPSQDQQMPSAPPN